MAVLILKVEGHLELDLSRTDINCKFLQNKIWIQLFAVCDCVCLRRYVVNEIIFYIQMVLLKLI